MERLQAHVRDLRAYSIALRNQQKGPLGQKPPATKPAPRPVPQMPFQTK